jgi:carbon starvation protein
VIADGMRICVRALRAGEPLPTTETPFEESRIEAPAGLIPTSKERELVRAGDSSG